MFDRCISSFVIYNATGIAYVTKKIAF